MNSSDNSLLDTADTRTTENINQDDLIQIRSHLHTILNSDSHELNYTLNKGKVHAKVVTLVLKVINNYIVFQKSCKSQGATSPMKTFKILSDEVQRIAA